MRNNETNGLEALAALASAAPAPTDDAEVGPDVNSLARASEANEEKTQSQAETLAANGPTSAAASARAAVASASLANPGLANQLAQQQQILQQQAAAGQHASPASSFGSSSGSASDLAFQQLQRRASDPAAALAMHTAYVQLMMQHQQSQSAHLAGLLGLNQGTSLAGHSMSLPNAGAGHPASPPSGRLVFGGAANASAAPTKAVAAAPAETASSSMPPPPPSAPSSPALAPPPLAAAPAARGTAPAFPRSLLSSSSKRAGTPSENEDGDSQQNSSTAVDGDKKEQKRAANRRSAQLSRKRKKQFIEELKDENDDLRRKEQILKSIPDLVVVFDSTGKLWFVSQSISRFIRFKAEELEGKSFWDRLCPESVRLLKAAFMDSLAARGDSQTDTVPLGEGLWDLRLSDKDGSFVTVTLNGVVHFAGERPECVCCIRPKDNSSLRHGDRNMGDDVPEEASARGATSQAVVSDMSTAMEHGASVGSEVVKQPPVVGNVGAAIRISDSGNSSGSGDSESGSSDELGARS